MQIILYSLHYTVLYWQHFHTLSTTFIIQPYSSRSTEQIF